MTRKKRIAYSLLLCAIGVGIAGLQCGLTPRHYNIQTSKVPEGKNLRILMLSDLHSCIYGKEQSQLLHFVKREQPDLILLCGDIVDDKYPQDGAKQLFSKIIDIAPCYYVSGNHEFWSGKAESIFRMIESYGIRVLRNESEEILIKNIPLTICGVDDPASVGGRQKRTYGDRNTYVKTLESFGDLPQDRFTILLAHRPEYINEYAKHSFDLTLCGHAHGGQWRIPYLMNGLIAPNQGWFPQYAGGQYICGQMTEIVGRGLLRDWKPRLFNPPEIVVVDIREIGV